MFEQPRNADFWSSTQTVPASFSPTAADNGMGSTVPPILDMNPVSEQILCQAPDNAYGNMQNAITHTLQGTSYPFGQINDLTTTFDAPMSFRERHTLLHQFYNSMPNPCAISAKDLGNMSKRVGLSMEEVLSWFEDEKSRREELLRACQNSHQWPLSPANTISSGLNRTLPLTMFQHDSQSPGSSILMQDSFPLHLPWTPSEDHVQAMAGEKRGRRSKQSLTPSSSPSPEAKRQKRSTEYPCPDCRKVFTADRWSEHVKRTHFPDQIWECQNINERTKKPCTSNPFFRAENFKTHLIGQHSCSNEEISRLAKACRFPVMNFFHQKCGFLGCGETFNAREDSIEHIKNHFRQIAQRSNPPKDLGVSQWEDNCASAHILKRGVHYRVVRGTARNNSEHNRDSNNDDGSGNDYSSSQPHKNSQSGPDEGAPPGGEDTSSDSAYFDSSQDSSYMSYGQYSAISPQIESKSECATQSSSYTIGLEEDVLPFTIRRRLGFGGHGLVDEVFSVSSKETFARKSVLLSGGISDTSPQMVHLKNELSILKGLSHPHLVKLIGAYADAKYSHIIMSPVADQNLADYMLSSLSAGGEGLCRWMGCLTSAIYYLHGQGIQHLDIKPQNILLKGDDILLADFGTAKSFEGWLVNRKILAVTPMYSAPETMLYGRQEFCSDIFSLGCVFSEMMTRQSGRSIRQFEEFRSRSGKKAFHLTISEVRNWITFLPWTIPSNGLPIHPAEDQKKMSETILHMLAEVSSDRPTSSELQSCFIELGCHQCKPVTSGETAPSSPTAPDEDSSENSPSCGTALPSKLIGSKLSTNITLSEASATTSPEVMYVDCIDDADRRNPAHPPSPSSSSLDKISLSTGIGKTTSQNPAQSSSQSGDSSTEEGFAASAAKSDFTCSMCRNVSNDMKAHMLTHQNEPSIKCPIQTCHYQTKDFAEEHDKAQKLLSHCENPTFCGSCPSNQSILERTFNWTEALEKHLTKVHGIGEIPDNDSALPGLGKMSGEPSTRYSDHPVESPAYASVVENKLNVHAHLNEYVPGIKCEWDEAASVSVQLMKEGDTKPIMLKTTQETIHRGSSQLQADYDMPRFPTDILAANSNHSIFPSCNRTYSVSSNGTPDQGFDSLLHSTQGDLETLATEFSDDTQAMGDEAKSLMQYNPKVLLSRLYIKESITIHTPYRQVTSHSEAVIDQKSKASDHLQDAPDSDIYQLVSLPEIAQNILEEPLAQINSHAFAKDFDVLTPSHGSLPSLSAGFHSELSQSIEVHSQPDSQSGPSQETTASRKIPFSKGNEKVSFYGWEKTAVARRGLLRVSEILEEEVRKRGGARTGGLDPQAKTNALRIRMSRACWNCWVEKVPCSEGQRCARCQYIKQSSFLGPVLCSQSAFRDYESTLFPEFMHCHLRKRKVEDLLTEYVSGFLDTFLMIEVSTGSAFEPLVLRANLYLPQTCDLLVQSSLTPPEAEQPSRFVQMLSAPIGLLGFSISELKKKCDRHIENMIVNPQYPAQTTAGDLTQLPFQILENVCQYATKNKNRRLLRNALKLHAIHYFMGSLITFTPKSAHEIYTKSLYSSFSTPPPFLSSRILNRQIKYAMNKLHREITLLVLEDLERSLRSRTRDSWGPSFCAILMLCLCIEKLQAAADVMVVCDLLECGEASSYTRDQSLIACQELDEYPFQQCTKLFHDIYKTRKDSRRGKRLAEKGFNPLAAGAEKGATGLDSSTEEMVRGMHEVVSNSWPEILESSERPAIVSTDIPVDPHDIQVNSTGRLAAKFLKSFFVDV